MWVYLIVPRTLMLAITAVVCIRLAERVGPVRAVGIWAIGMAAICSATAALMHRQPIGKVTFINRLAGLLMPWGYRIGRGKLWPIVLISWSVWVALAIAITAALTGYHNASPAAISTTPPDNHRRLLVIVLLFLSWIIDGVVFMRLLSASARNTRIPPSVFLPLGIIATMIVASMIRTVHGHTLASLTWALALCGGPPLLIGGGFGLMFLVMITFGRHSRWN